MIKLGRIVEEVQEKRKFMKAALEIAIGLSKRGYYPKEAVEDATRSVMHKMGYKFNKKEKASLEKVIPVHPNFR